MKKTLIIVGKIILYIILFLIIAYLIIGFFVVPHIITKTIPKKVSTQNATLVIKKASFNPLTLNIRIKDITLKNNSEISQDDNIKIQELKIQNLKRANKNTQGEVFSLNDSNSSQEISLNQTVDSSNLDGPINYKDIFSLNEFSAKISPLALFSKTIRVEHIRVIEPSINLYKDSNGKMNIQDLLYKAEEQPEISDSNKNKNETEDIDKNIEKADEKSLEIKPPFNIILDEASIIDGKFNFTDLSLFEPFQTVIDNINYRILGINLYNNSAGDHEFGADSHFLKNISWEGKFEINPIKAYGNFSLNELDLHEVSKTIQTSLSQDINSAKINASINYFIEISKNKNIIKLENSHFKLYNIDIFDKNTNTQLIVKRVAVPKIDIDASIDQNQNATIALKSINIDGLKFKDKQISANFDSFAINTIDTKVNYYNKNLQADTNINEIDLQNLNFSDNQIKANLNSLNLNSVNAAANQNENGLDANASLGKLSLKNVYFSDKNMKAMLNLFELNSLNSNIFQKEDLLQAKANLKNIVLNSVNFSDKDINALNENLMLNSIDVNLSKFKDDINLTSNLGQFSLNETKFSDKQMSANLNSLSLNNLKIILNKLKDDLKLNSNLDSINLNKIAFKDKDMSANIDAISLNSVGTNVEQIKANTNIDSNLGSLSINSVNFKDKNMNANLGQINLNKLNNIVNLSKDSLKLNSNLGNLNLSKINYNDNVFTMNNNLLALSQINAQVNQNGKILNLNTNLGSLNTNTISLLVQKQKFLDLASLNVTNANYIDNTAANIAKVGNLNLKGFKVFSNGATFSNFNALSVNQVNFDIKKNSLNVNSITLDSLKAFVSFINDKVLELENLPSFEDKSKKPAPKPVAKPNTQTKPNSGPKPQKPKTPDFTFAINKIGLTNSAISLKDNFSGKIVQNNITNINVLIEKISSNFAKPFNVNASLNFDPKSKLATNGSVQIEPLNLNLNSNINIANLGIFSSYAQKFTNLDIKSGSLNLKSQTKYGKNMSVNADVNLANLNIFDTNTNQALTSLGSLNVSKLNLTDNSATIDKININAPFFEAIKGFDGKFNFESILKEQKKPEPKPAPKTPDKPVPKKEEKKSEFGVIINQVTVGNGAVNFTDNSLQSGQFKASVTGIKADITNIAKNRLSDINLNAIINKYGMVDVKAKTYIFDFEKLTNLNLVVKSLGLTSFTPFTQEFIGYNITNGTLNVRADYKINDSKISANNYLNLDNVQMQENKASKNVTSIPINLALSLLKNRNNQIDFSVPVSGSLKDPNFKLFGTIMNTVGQIMTNIVLSPFRAVGNLLGIDNSDDDKGIDFEVGSAKFPPSEIAKFDYIKNELAKNKNLNISITPTFNQIMDSYMLKRQKYANDLQIIATKQKVNKQSAMQILAAQRRVSTKSSNLEGDLILSYKASRDDLTNLANQRAQSIKNELVKLGVNLNRISVKSPSQADTKHKKFVLSTIEAN